MNIESIIIFRVSMPLIYPFRTAFGNDEFIESVLVKMSSGKTSGWGEASPWSGPRYSQECATTLFLIARDFIAPQIIGKDISSGHDLQLILSNIRGNYFAKACFDLAWWDLYAKILEKPLWKVIGGKNPIVSVGADIGVMENIDILIEEINNAVVQGFKRVKLKYRPGWDLGVVDRVRNKFPDLAIHIDCNSAYTLDDIDMFKKLDQYNLKMIEQPLMFDDLIDHAALQSQIKTPVCLDESITSVDKARKAISIKACQWINIKPGRVGGITNAVAIHDLAKSSGIPCWIGGMLESAIGANHCLALATLPNIKYPSDIFPTSRFYDKDIAYPPMILSSAGEFHVKTDPGIGAEPDPEVFENSIIEREYFKV